MNRKALAATLLITLPLATPLAAQSQQEQLEARYDRALAAGYKALFLCSAIANAERVGATRTPESVHEWELTGIQAPLDAIVRDLPYEIVRQPDYRVSHVLVSWADMASPRVARYDEKRGCTVLPLETSVASQTQGDTSGQPTIPPPPRMTSWTRDTRLDPAFEGAFQEAYGAGTRTTALTVSHDGKQSSQYRRGFNPLVPQRTWSVAKSIAATLVGAAVHRGEADVSASAGLGADESDPRRAITIDHLLRMASGRYADTPGNRTDPLYFGGSTVEETALHWPLIHEPNSVYRYANNDTLAAVKAIEETFEARPPAEFFAKLGMHHTVAETDWQGAYILSSQVWSTADDLVKLGQLYLNGGVLPSGERILPEGWVQYVSSPSGPQPEASPFGYGAGFWLFNKSEGVPPDTFAAMGNRGQYVVIVPSRDVVIVRRGEDPVGSRFDIAAFTRDVLAALEK